MRRTVKKFHRNLYYISVFLVFLPFWPVLYILGKKSHKHYSTLIKIRRILADVASAVVGFRYQVHWEADVDWNRNYIICANHTSNLDITAVMKVCKNDFSFIGKEELLDNPVTGFYFRTIDIPIKRTSKISSFRAFKRAQSYLEEGKSVAIFPEGGIGDEYPPELYPFKNGLFKLACDLKRPILPVVIKDAWKVFWDDGNKTGSKPGIIHIQVLKPIDGEALNQTPEELKDQVYHLFRKNLGDTDDCA